MNEFIIKPSVQGVGVFTLKSIEMDTLMDLFSSQDYKFLNHNEAQGLLYDQFCLQAPNGRICPVDFNKMSIGWYLNHSEHPNLIERGGKLFTSSYIRKDDELMINYNHLHRLFPQIKLDGREY